MAENSKSGEDSDLIAALQEKENDIKTKSSEIQRLMTQNHDLEEEVVFKLI